MEGWQVRNKIFVVLSILFDTRALFTGGRTRPTIPNTLDFGRSRPTRVSASSDGRMTLPNAQDIRGLEALGAQQVREQLGSTVQSTLSPELEIKSQFRTDAPKIEQQAEQSIAGRLGSPIDISQAQADKAFEARRKRQEASFDRERQRSEAQFNRLGLASSTPGLQAQQDISRAQTLAEEDLSAQIAREDISRQLQAEQLAQSLINQAINLGQIQTGREQFAIGASFDDVARQRAGVGTGLAFLGQEAFQPEDIAFIEELRRQQGLPSFNRG